MDAYSKKLERKVTFLKTYHPFTSGKLLQEWDICIATVSFIEISNHKIFWTVSMCWNYVILVGPFILQSSKKLFYIYSQRQTFCGTLDYVPP